MSAEMALRAHAASLPSIFTACPEAPVRMRDFFSSHISIPAALTWRRFGSSPPSVPNAASWISLRLSQFMWRRLWRRSSSSTPNPQ